MLDIELARKIVNRLNALIEAVPEKDKDRFRYEMGKLLAASVTVGVVMLDHPTIQVRPLDGHKDEAHLNLIGLLNGLVGVRKDWRRPGGGYVASEHDEKGRFVRFIVTVDVDQKV